MIKILKQNKKKILFTLAMLFVYLLGSNIAVPGLNTLMMDAMIADTSILNVMNLLGGGSIQRLSIFAMGVGPYITASIVIQLLSMDVIPYLTEQTKNGKKGKAKLDKITRYFGVVLGFIQSFTMVMAFDKTYGILLNSSIMSYITTATVLTAGTMLLLWIGDKITDKGIGNGVSLIIFAGIVSSLPTTFINMFNSLVNLGDSSTLLKGSVEFGLFVLMYLLIILSVLVITLAERRIPIHNHGAGKSVNHLPLKINTAGVIPVIFAQAILTSPLIIMSFINQDLFKKMSKFLSFDNVYILVIYAILVVVFTFFYTNLQLDSDDVADNLRKGGSYITGIRPGKDTSTYIKRVLNRITILGALGLTVLALIPYLLPRFTNIPSSAAIGGTGVIIVVGVAIETVKQLKTVTYKDKYQQYLK